MKQYEYVPKEEWKPVKRNLISIIHEVQNLLRDEFTFSFSFVGSSHRGMITREEGGNRGYDFDVDIRVNDDEEEFTAKELKYKIKNALNKVAWRYGYGPCEDSTRVITMKVIDRLTSRILYGCDFAIVNDYYDEDNNRRQQFVYYDKTTREYLWKDRSREYCNLKKNEALIKQAGKREELKDVYREKKRNNSEEKESRSLYVEAVHEVVSRLP